MNNFFYFRNGILFANAVWIQAQAHASIYLVWLTIFVVWLLLLPLFHMSRQFLALFALEIQFRLPHNLFIRTWFENLAIGLFVPSFCMR